ncbi:MAG: DUF3301 domain-containing protein [Burkholderiales bacterium]|nr:DUF3301 domain-containing protein [Pseudomonadota bacterium]
MIQLFFIFLIAMLIWFWHDTMQAREHAIVIGKRHCQNDGLQLLDETVSLSSMKLRRNDDGQMMFRRVYEFEFSDNGDNRRLGSITLLGRHAESIQLEPHLMQ